MNPSTAHRYCIDARGRWAVGAGFRHATLQAGAMNGHRPTGRRSAESGLLMLASFPADGSYLGNAELARMLDMNPSTSHRYVSTLVAVGPLERDPATRRYRRAS
jgi:hypothetical protein